MITTSACRTRDGHTPIQLDGDLRELVHEIERNQGLLTPNERRLFNRALSALHLDIEVKASIPTSVLNAQASLILAQQPDADEIVSFIFRSSHAIVDLLAKLV